MDPAFGSVDDLFQEDGAPRLSSRRIDTRLDELRRGGCNQKIAWSKLGCIAIIDAAGTGVETRHLACNPSDGRWQLSEAYPIAHVSQHHDGARLQHIAWSSPGSELAVVDVLGRVSFYTVYLAVNQLTLATIHAGEHEDDVAALVGFWWLPIERMYSLHKSAVREEGGTFKYQAPQYRPFGPFHPVLHKAAAIGITRGGTVKLWFHDAMGRYQQSTTELESFSVVEDLFSHASVSWNKDNVAVVAAYTLSRQLRTYRLTINWNVANVPNKMQAQFPTSPTFVVQRVKVEDHVCAADLTPDTCRAQLSHLEVLGPTPGPANSQLLPRIVAVLSGKTAEGQPFSVICQWDLRASPSALHPSFDQIGVRRASVSSPTTTESELHRLDDIMVDKFVIGIWPVTSGSVVAFAFSDGSLDFRDRYTFDPLSNDLPNRDMVTNMIQAGFSFPSAEPCVDLALSPSNAVAVRLGYDHDVHMTVMEYTAGPLTEGDNLELACVALALQHAYSCLNFLNNDDLLLVARKYRSAVFNNTFLTEVLRALNLKMVFAVEALGERLIRNAMLQRCLSLQYALDFRGERATKKLSGKLAWATLHLRVASLAFTVTSNQPQRQVKPTGGAGDIDLRPEALQTLLGLVKWFMDMLSLIISDLGELSKAAGGRTELGVIQEKMLESNSPALLLMLASAPRAFLRYNCRILRGLEGAVTRQLQSGTLDDEQKMTFKSFKVPLDSCAIKIGQFDKILTDMDGTIRAAYNNVPESDRANAERILFVRSEIPSIFSAPLDRLLNTTLPLLRRDIALAALFWTDVTWLGFHDDPGSQEFHRKHRVDALRKIILPGVTGEGGGGNGGGGGGKGGGAGGGVRLRRCTRCCAVIEELGGVKSQGWLATMQRMCLCGTLWMQLGPAGAA